MDWLAEILQNRCPGFLETEKALTPKAAKTRPLSSAWKIGLTITFWLGQAGRLVLRKYVLRDTRSALPASRSVLVGVHREVEESQTDPVSVV